MNRNLAFAVCMFLSSLSGSSFAGERGVFGFGLSVEGDGFFNPTLRSVKVSKVSAQSPAAAGGMRVGDEILEVAGNLVVGAKAKDLQSLLEKEVGQSLVIKVRHAAGDVADLSLVAASRESLK